MTDTFITGQTTHGQQAIVALDQVVSVVENVTKDNITIMIRLRDQTYLEMAMDITTFWALIPGSAKFVRDLKVNGD